MERARSPHLLLVALLGGAVLTLLAGVRAVDVIAWIDDEPVTLAAYQEHLLRMHGLSELDAFLDDRLLLQEAARAHVSLPYEDLEPLVEERLAAARAIFKRDPGGFDASLARRGLTVTDFRRQLQRKVLRDHALDGILAARRNAAPHDTPSTETTEGPSASPLDTVTEDALLEELHRRVRFDGESAQRIVDRRLSSP